MKQFLLYFGATVGFGVLAVGVVMLVMRGGETKFDTLPVEIAHVEDASAEVAAPPTQPKDSPPRSAPMTSKMSPSPMSPAPMRPATNITDLASVPLPRLTEVSGRPLKTILNRLRDRQIQKWFPNGDRLLLLYLSNISPSEISVVDVSTGQEVWAQRTDQELGAAAVSADGKAIAVAERGAKVTVYDAATGQVTQTIEGPAAVGGAENVTDLRFDETGQKIITAHYDRTIRTWDLASQKEIGRLQAGDHETHLFGFVGPWLHTRNSEKHQWWSVDQTGVQLHFETDRQQRLAELSTDGRFLAVNIGNDIGILNVSERSVHRTLSVPERDSEDQLSRLARGLSTQVSILGGSFSADGTRFAAATSAGANVVWDVETGDVIYDESFERPATFPRSHSDMLSPDGKRCLRTTAEGSIAVADLDGTGEPKELTETLAVVDWRTTQSTALSHNGQTEAVTLVGGAIEVRDTVAGKAIWTSASLTDVTRPLSEGPNSEFTTSDISAFAVSNGGTFVIATTHCGELIFVTKEQPQTPTKTAAEAGEPVCVALSPDNRFAVIATIQGHIIRVDVDATVQSQTISSETLATIDGETQRCSALAIDAASRTVALGLANGNVEIRSLDAFAVDRSLTGADGPVRYITFSEDGQQVACTTYSGTAFVWDVADGGPPKARTPQAKGDDFTSPVASVSQQAIGPRAPVKFSPDGTRLLVGRSRSIDVLDVTNGTVIEKLDFPGDARDLAIRSSDNRWLASRAWGEIYEWAPSPKEVMTLQPDEKNCRFVQFTPDGKLLITGVHGNVVRFFDATTGELQFEGKAETGGAHEGTVSPDGTKLAVCGMATGIEVWDIPGRKSLGKYYGHDGRAISVAFSPDSKLVASGSEDGTVRIREVKSKKQIKSFDGHELHPAAVAFSPDGRFLLSASSNWKEQDKNGVLRIWDTSSGKLLKSMAEPFGQVQGLGFSPFDSSFVISVANTMLTLRDVNSCQVTDQFTDNWGLNHPRYLLHGRLLTYLEYPSTIHVRDVLTGKELTTLRTRTMVFELATLPNGNVIAAACEDGTVHVWRLGN